MNLASWIARLVALPACLLFLSAAVVRAQETAIAGVVKDASGSVLPGVTVEASSPTLIEKTRTASTDGSGQYKIIDLSPGTYTVTFTLAGFGTVRREGIELVYGFIAPVNSEMRVGNVSETITVTAASPVVDIQSVAQSTVMTREVMDSIPQGKNIQAVGILIPGTALQVGGGSALSRDVGGSGNMQQSPLIYHGSSNSVTAVDGLRMNDFEVAGQYADLFNDGSFQEVSYTTGADSAEVGNGGLRINMVPKDGGNSFHGSVPGNWTGSAWQWNNLTDDLMARGTTNVSQVKTIYDFNPSFGGPIKKDKLWFQVTYRRQRVDKTVVDSYFNLNGPTSIQYVPDLTRPAIDDGWAWNASGRATYQVNRKSKATIYFDRSNRERPHWGASATNPPEAAGVQTLPMEFTESIKFQSTLTHRLLLELGFGEYHQDYSEFYQPEVTPTTYRIVDQTSGKACCAYTAQVIHLQKLFDYSAKLSYVTGSHNLSAGWTVGLGPHETITTRTGDLSMRFGAATVNATNGYGPNQVTLNLPTDQVEHMDLDSGLWINDKWTIKRATITAGLRFDWFIGSVGTEAVLPNPWLPAQTFPGVNNVPNWKDISPRLGIAYDVFGNGKTAVKFSASRYDDPQTIGFAASQGPIGRLANSISLTWTDTNKDFTIFNPDGSVQTSELAPIPASSTFGTLVPATTRVDPNIQTGYGVRGYTWEFDGTLQQEILPRVSASFTYYRRILGGNALSTQNLNGGPSTYQGPYCIATPTDPRLPDNGGETLCGIYERTPASFNTPADNYQTFLKNYLDPLGITQKNYRHGFDISVRARIHNGGVIQGGISFARSVSDTCYTALLGSPQIIVSPTTGQSSCYNTPPFQPDAKLLASYNLPWNIAVSGTFQYTPGPQESANWTFTQAIANANGFAIATAPGSTNQQIAAANQSIDLLTGTQIYDRGLKQLDLRAARRIRFGSKRLEIQADLYNVFNSHWIFGENGTFGTGATAAATWLRPTNILSARMFKMGAQFDF